MGFALADYRWLNFDPFILKLPAYPSINGLGEEIGPADLGVLHPAPGKDEARLYDYPDEKFGVLVNAAAGLPTIIYNKGTDMTKADLISAMAAQANLTKAET